MRRYGLLGLSVLGLVLARPAQAQLGQVSKDVAGVLIAAFVVLFVLVIALVLLSQIVYICNPNEILIFSGREHRLRSGQKVGYRVVFGGAAIRIPILESVERMDLTTMPVQVEVKNAYSAGGIPLQIQAIANIKVSSDPEIVGNAIERFLGRKREEIIRVAKETLEGNLRSVVATLTPEQVNEDRLQFADRISRFVERDLAKLGLQLDTLKIQSVSDEVDYLNSIGRRQIAEMLRDAQIAESNAEREAEAAVAESRRAEVAQKEAQAAIQQKQNEHRKRKAELELQARAEEERTEAIAQETRAKAEQELQAVRAELERLRLEADVVLPAQAQRQAQEFLARGQAAQLAAKAKATAAVAEMLNALWQEYGQDASAILLIQQLETLLTTAAQVPQKLQVDRVHVIDSGQGQTLSALMRAYPEMVQQFLQQADRTLGLNLAQVLQTPPPAHQ
ncbi:MAG: SPFH domain-containing protein [Gloeomargarita sp. SKYBB_i_bin120]|nr:SPFH domain-containing protein [Gloeomargarita sp. SKYB120]MDW8178841.1 SPFH domain-containing protein [Gloeomargarita sp. SKYBB_i_bin120]